MSTTKSQCNDVLDDLAGLVAGEPAVIARHADHLATCDDCRDARHDAAQLANAVAGAGADYAPPPDLAARVLATIDAEQAPPKIEAPKRADVVPMRAKASRRVTWIAAGAAAIAASTVGIVALKRADGPSALATNDDTGPSVAATGPAGTVTRIERAAADQTTGLTVIAGGAPARPLLANEAIPRGAELRTDDKTRVLLTLGDGTKLTLDHATAITLAAAEPRQITMAAGRLVADVAHVARRPASITTASGRIDVIGTRFAVAATDAMTSVQVVRGAVMLHTTAGASQEVRAGEEGTIDRGALTVAAAPGLSRDIEWSELAGEGATPAPADEAVTAGLGALRAYKPGESRDRDWKLALAKHDVKVRIVGPIARTEITETFRNDSDATLEGVYQFPLPADAQIDGLALDVATAPGGFEQGAFVDKNRAAKIWRGVIDKATPKRVNRPSEQDIIWVQGPWRDPALLDWKRGGRFELKIFPIPPKGARTIKIAYTQVVTPRGATRQYVYPLPHSADGSTVADELNVDVEIRGAEPGTARTPTYAFVADPARGDVEARTLKQTGFVPRGDLVIDYRASEGDAELRAWSYQGGAAMAPDEKLAARKNVGNDEAVTVAQRAAAADARPTAVVALKPKLPRWDASKPRDYVIAVDLSQSMVGERATRATALATSLVEQLDRRDRVSVLACDTECRKAGALAAASPAAAKTAGAWLTAQTAAGASDVVASVRAALAELPRDAQRERWVIYIGDGFATTGFRRQADVERAIAQSTTDASGARVATIGIGADADDALLGAVARGGGGSFLAYRPGESIATAAQSAIDSTLGSALRDATVELPGGLADVAPTILPTIRAGEEVLVAARIAGAVEGDVILRGTVAGEKFEQRYPLKLAVSTAAGNGFVPRLWASLAIEQLERAGGSGDRARVVALSQGYGVMSKETSLLVLESAAMFEAFGVDRRAASATWTGEDAVEEATAAGIIALGESNGTGAGYGTRAGKSMALDAGDESEDLAWDDNKHAEKAKKDVASPRKMPMPEPAAKPAAPATTVATRAAGPSIGMGRAGMIPMRRVWFKVPAVAPFDGVSPQIQKAIADAETALAAAPDSRERHRALVQALSYAGELDRARDVAAKWLERDRLDPQALGYTADLLGREGQRDLALRTLSGLVDLDADRVALHERLVRAYEQAGRMSQACSHRIAVAALQAKDARAAGAAMRCLRSLGKTGDAELVSRALPDAATQAAAEKAALVAPITAPTARDLAISGRWSGGEDLDISLVAPDGTRISWMGGRLDASASDVTSASGERLGLRTLRKGNYLVEVTRLPSMTPVRGTLDITAIGLKRAVPFELTGNRTVVARITIGMQSRLERVWQ